MPTTRRKRSRNLRHIPGSAIERFIHGEITVDELSAEHGAFAQFAVTVQGTTLGKQAFEIWQRDGKALLDAHNYRGRGCYPGTNIIDTGNLPPNLVRMVDAFGVP